MHISGIGKTIGCAHYRRGGRILASSYWALDDLVLALRINKELIQLIALHLNLHFYLGKVTLYLSSVYSAAGQW